MDPRITICIVHYNKLDRLRNTVSALEENTDQPYILKILNNGYEDDEILSYLTDLENKDYTEIIYGEENLGCPPGRNWILRDIDTPYAMTLDDDMYVEEGWLEEVFDIFSTDSDIGVIGIPYWEGNTLRGGARVETDRNIVNVDQLDWDDISDEQRTIQVEDVPGGTMVFRTALLEEFAWGSQFFVGMGDLDKSLQIMETDWKQVMATHIAFEHNVTTDEDYAQVRKDYRERHRSYRKFVSKWGYRLSLREHIMFNYLFRLPWPVVNRIEKLYDRISE